MERGYIQVYYGDGKGKTTAAVGQAVRAAGAGMSVCFAQFLKSGASCELEGLRSLGIRMHDLTAGGGKRFICCLVVAC